MPKYIDKIEEELNKRNRKAALEAAAGSAVGSGALTMALNAAGGTPLMKTLRPAAAAALVGGGVVGG